MCLYVYLSVFMCTMYMSLEFRQDIGSPGTGLTGGCELPHVCGGTEPHSVLCKDLTSSTP